MRSPSLPLALLLSTSALLAACASNSAPGAIDGGSIAHPYTAEDKAYLASTVPIKTDRVTLYVHGIGCPLCASGVDYAVMKLPGVQSSKLNLATNTVDVTMAGPNRPTPKQLNEAVALDFTLVKIEEVR